MQPFFIRMHVSCIAPAMLRGALCTRRNDFHEVHNARGSQLMQDFRAMLGDRRNANLQIDGDLFVASTVQKQIEDFPFLDGKVGNAAPQRILARLFQAPLHGEVHGAPDALQQELTLWRLLQEIDSAGLDGLNGGRNVAVSRQEDDGDGGISLVQAFLKTQSAQARKSDVQHEATRPVVSATSPFQELLGCGRKLDAQPRLCRERGQDPTHLRVIIDYEYRSSSLHHGPHNPAVAQSIKGHGNLSESSVFHQTVDRRKISKVGQRTKFAGLVAT